MKIFQLMAVTKLSITKFLNRVYFKAQYLPYNQVNFQKFHPKKKLILTEFLKDFLSNENQSCRIKNEINKLFCLLLV